MSVKRYQPVAQCVEPSYQAQMIEPKVMEFSEGEYVRWEDYDATCETLAHTETERDASDAEVERLKAEVERLRKAGDAMLYNMTYYKSFVPDNGNIHHMIDASILGWNPKYGHTTEYGKAKEGKQS